jgi:hypothetical protein
MSEENSGSRLALIVPGAVLVLVGLMVVAGTFVPGLISMDKIWPLFMLIPVAIFIVNLAQNGRRAEGVLVPLVILTGLTVYFLWLNYTTWGNSASTWPVYILLPGLGLFVLYLSNRATALLIPVSILVGLSVVFFAFTSGNRVAGGVAFIALGVLVILFPFLRGKKSS